MNNFKDNIREIITEHTLKLTELIGEKKELYDKFSELLQEKSILEKRLNKVNTESSVVRSDQNRIIEINDPKLNEEIDRLTNLLQKLNKEKDSIISKKSDIEKELDKTKNDLEKLQEENKQYLSDIKTMKNNNDANLKEIENLKDQIDIINNRPTMFNEGTDDTDGIINKLTISHKTELELLRKQLESKEKYLLEKEKLLSDMKEQTQKEIEDLTNQIENLNKDNSEILTMMNKFKINSEILFDRAKTYNISESKPVTFLPNKLRLKNDLNIPAEFTQNIPPEFTQKSNYGQILEMINYIEKSITRYSGNEKTDDITNIINIIKETLRKGIINDSIKLEMKKHIDKIKILCENISDNKSNEYFCEIYEALSVLLKKILEIINVISSDSDSDFESMIVNKNYPRLQRSKPVQQLISDESDAKNLELSATSNSFDENNASYIRETINAINVLKEKYKSAFNEEELNKLDNLINLLKLNNIDFNNEEFKNLFNEINKICIDTNGNKIDPKNVMCRIINLVNEFKLKVI
jgi:myosin heavy subunit